MPVTAKLSKKLYDTLGEDLANELVEWFNQVDSSYQINLREVNDLNFQRFDAKLEQRLAQFDARWEKRFAQLEIAWEERIAGLHSKISDLRAELIKWMFLFWLGTVATVLGFVSLIP